LGSVWAVLGAVLDHLGSKLVLEAVSANFGRRWKGQDGVRMGPESAKMRHVGAKLAGLCGQEAPRNIQKGLVGAMLGALRRIWGAFGNILMKIFKQKTVKNLRFFIVFCYLGGSPRAS